MRPSRVFRMLVPAVLGIAAAASGIAAGPPATRKDDVKEIVQGVEIADPYRWLEDQKSPETRAWIDAQNAYTQSVLSGLPGKEALEKRLGELLRVDVTTTPTERNGRYFFSRRRADKDLPILYVRQGLDSPDEVLIDPLPLSPDHTTSVNFLDVSQDGSEVAYAVRLGGEDEVTVRFLLVDGHRELPDTLPHARYSGVALTADKSAVYYSKQTPDGPRVYRHRMGTDVGADEKLFGDGYGPEKIIGVRLSDEGEYLQLVVSHGSAAVQTEVYFQDLAGGGAITPVVNDVAARFAPTIAGDRMFLQTNWEAQNGRVLAVDLKSPARANWKEVVPEGKFAIQDIAAAGDRLFVRSLENVIPKVRIYDATGQARGEIAFPEIGNVGNVSGEWGKSEAFFTYQSFVVPPTIYRYDVRTGKRTVWAKQEVPVASDRFTVEQVRYASKDGTEIPMFLVHRKNLPRDGKNPTLLTGYGGFTLSQTPAFSFRAALWAERGGVYAIANLRGGSEFGEAWHLAGMLDRKQNVFDDFIGAAEWLVAKKYTSKQRLAITGGSNGGLLVGAALTQRPDLFSAVVCSYPLLDMVRYHKFLVASYWVPEYGSADNPSQFPSLYAYSPYHHVKAGADYPAVLFITGDSDTRVAPLHARKMTALLQADSGDEAKRPILLYYDTKAGHSRGFNTPVAKQIEDTTLEMRFLFWQLGMAPAAAQPVKKAA
ncbi:MAG TPA: prolyl oligopeptidase family serine peptidase [Thermoanaerobaculia bacterium]|nr:prolyl oligopeptidase family serine peptidase [Thermoanaerobaculia bacterium]